MTAGPRPGPADVEIRLATPDRIPGLAAAFGRAFVNEPMMTWPFGTDGDVAGRMEQAFRFYFDSIAHLEILWEAGDGLGGLVMVPEDGIPAWEVAQSDDGRIQAIAGNDGQRYHSMWEWVIERTAGQGVWLLDALAVDPAAQGRGVGAALVRHGLAQANAADRSTFLETGTPGNVAFYEHLGFHVVDEGDAPGGGPHIWFLRHDS